MLVLLWTEAYKIHSLALGTCNCYLLLLFLYSYLYFFIIATKTARPLKYRKQTGITKNFINKCRIESNKIKLKGELKEKNFFNRKIGSTLSPTPSLKKYLFSRKRRQIVYTDMQMNSLVWFYIKKYSSKLGINKRFL